jgi:hypothetical protein
MTQKGAEFLEYSNLLVKANKTEDPVKQLIHVTAAFIAQYACTTHRIYKPFTPVLGETY